MIDLPDKSTYKTTVTDKLRKDIRNVISSNECTSYLEVGCDQGYTTLSVSKNLTRIVAIDIDKNRAEKCRQRLSSLENCKVDVITGTSENIPIESYDIILIDADHTYDGVKKDYENVKAKNLSKRYFIVFHDYGLESGGVKKFVNETFSDYKKIGLDKNWNPLGGHVNDFEAVVVEVLT